jgi:hypothetical protein
MRKFVCFPQKNNKNKNITSKKYNFLFEFTFVLNNSLRNDVEFYLKKEFIYEIKLEKNFY